MKKYNYVRKTFTFDGKRYEIVGKTEKEAITKMVNKQRDLQEGKVVVSGDTTVAAWATKCVETYKTNQSDITRKTYLSRMKTCITDKIGNRPLKTIKPFDVQNLLNDLHNDSKSQYQISAVYQMLRFIFSKAKVNKLIAEDPTLDLQKPRGTKNKRRALTKEEEEHFLKVCEGTDRFIAFLLMYYCGCRTSEAREAMGKDIIQIADGEETYPALHIRGTKTKNADRNVPIPPELYERIKDTPKSSYIATNKAGDKYTESSFRYVIKALRKAINISMGCKVKKGALVPPLPLAEDFVPYCLRHTYCTNLCKKGVDIRTAQHLMGHSTIELTANIYTHIDNSSVITAAKKMNDVENGVEKSVQPVEI